MAAGRLSTFVRRLRGVLVRQEPGAQSDEALLLGFLRRGDGAAFEALVRRHGPMVLGVCRRLLRHEQDAEDAFQATFLVLARKAGSVRPRAMVGNWLYGVACRTALGARRAAALRRAKEAAVPPRTQPAGDDRADLRAALDRELQCLPDRCRAVIVLSDLEGKTRKEVALQLGWPEGTVASRLARARARLAKRLARHGLAWSAVAAGSLLPEGTAPACVPASLVVSTVNAAGLLAAGQASAGAVPTRVVALAEGVSKAMLLDKVLKTAALLFVIVALGAGAGLVLSQSPGAGPKAEGPGVPQGPETSKEVDVGKEFDALKGVWQCVGYERDGEEHVGDQVKDALWNERLWFHRGTPQDDWLNINWERKGVGGTSAAAVFTLRPATRPNGIDLIWKSVPAREYMPKGIDPAWEDATSNERILDRSQPGVYAVEGDRLRLCWGELGGERPASVKTKRGDGRTVHLYRLVSPPAPRADEAEAVAWVERQRSEKGEVFGRGWVTRKGGSVVGVSLAGTQVTGADLRRLAPFEKLQELDLSRTDLGKAGLKDLPPLTELRTLRLMDTDGVTAEGLRALAPCKELQSLELRGTQAGDAGLKELARLKRLKSLDLGRTNVTDEGLKALAGLEELQVLELGVTGVTDAGLKEVGRLEGLQTLGLAHLPVTDAGLKQLAPLKGLRRLTLSSTRITNAGLKELAGLPELRTLDLRGGTVGVTDAGAAGLRKVLPECEVLR